MTDYGKGFMQDTYRGGGMTGIKRKPKKQSLTGNLSDRGRNQLGGRRGTGDARLSRQALHKAHGMNRNQLERKVKKITTRYRTQQFLPGGNKSQRGNIRSQLMAYRKGLGQELIGKKAYKKTRGNKMARS